MKKRVLILGAGLSGLSAAVHLILKGYQVTILEKRPFAGGRIFSFFKEFWPFPIDNGPHVMLGCYESMLELLKIVNGGKQLDYQSKLLVPYCLQNGQMEYLKAASLPSPFHLLFGLFRFPLLNMPEKLSISRVFVKIFLIQESEDMDKISNQQWFEEQKQNENSIAVFWRPLTLATLNAEPGQVSFLQLFRVLKIGFLQGKKESRMILIPNGLTQTIINPILDWLKKNGCQIKYRNSVTQFIINERIEKVRTTKEIFDNFNLVISALPLIVFTNLIKNSDIKDLNEFDGLNNLQTSAIMNFHFWYKGKLIQEQFTAIHNSVSQWLFVHQTEGQVTHYSIVVSGANDFLSKSKDEMFEIFTSELKEIFPQFHLKKLKHHYLTIEKNATLLCQPEIENCRLNVGPNWKNLFLTGDWTNTGLPPTMESAVRSGKIVAEKILEKDN